MCFVSCRQYNGIGTVIKQSLILWTDRLKMPKILEQAVVDGLQQVGFIYIIIQSIAKNLELNWYCSSQITF